MTSFFPQNYILPECKPEWNREAITVFSRLPSLRRLQATPLLQTSLVKTLSAQNSKIQSTGKPPYIGIMFEQVGKVCLWLC